MNWTLPNLSGHLPHHITPVVTFPSGARKWVVVGEDNSTPYRAYLLSYLRNSPPLKRSKPPHAFLVVFKGKVLYRLSRVRGLRVGQAYRNE
ncbi:hypothetical protein AVEN_46976-1 [Araneus ventricosus]|uniref:Uncharacterized protein n=1 Tax=Araneus ventricosus TaxID=182803 RepID=A0A4Y2URM2_ARAVE|nr:hypothetical protein AVEN_46976-1 [Araneus ventricosus]